MLFGFSFGFLASFQVSRRLLITLFCVIQQLITTVQFQDYLFRIMQLINLQSDFSYSHLAVFK